MPSLTMRSIPSIAFLRSHPPADESSEQGHDAPVISATLPNGDKVKSTDVIIALMGPTGSGKSTFLNSATGATVAIGADSLSSCTSKIVPVKVPLPSDPTRNLILVDTPGFDNPEFSDVKVMQMIAEWLKQTFQKKILLSGLLYFHKISDNRLAGTSLANLGIFEEICGRNAFSNVVLVTTMWGETDQRLGKTREQELRQKYWKKMIQGGSTTKPFEETSASAASILQPFIDPSSKRRAVLLQDELVNQGISLPRTSAGKALNLKLGEAGEQELLLMRQIDRDLERSDLDPKSIESLKHDRSKLESKSEETLASMKEFKTPFSSLIGDLARYPFSHNAKMTAKLMRRHIQPSKPTSEMILDTRKRIRNNERDPDLVVFVLGPTGSGKSSFINAVVGSNATRVEEDGGLSSVTDKVYTVLYSNDNGNMKQATRICFVDVPAFNHSAQSVKDALPVQIRTWLEINVWGKKVDSAIIYMNSLSTNRLNEPFSNHLEGFVDSCQEKSHTPIIALLLQIEVAYETLANQADEPFNLAVKTFGIVPAPRSIRFSTNCRPDRPNYSTKCNAVVQELVDQVASCKRHSYLRN